MGLAVGAIKSERYQNLEAGGLADNASPSSTLAIARQGEKTPVRGGDGDRADASSPRLEYDELFELGAAQERDVQLANGRSARVRGLRADEFDELWAQASADGEFSQSTWRILVVCRCTIEPALDDSDAPRVAKLPFSIVGQLFFAIDTMAASVEAEANSFRDESETQDQVLPEEPRLELAQDPETE